MDDESLLESAEERRSVESSAALIELRRMPCRRAGSSKEVRSAEVEPAERASASVRRAGAGAGTSSRLSGARSPQDPGILMAASARSHRLGERHRYHAFVLYHRCERAFVDRLVRRLEAGPHEYRCCLDTRDFSAGQSRLQNVVCALSLSERVLLVLCPHLLAAEGAALDELLLGGGSAAAAAAAAHSSITDSGALQLHSRVLALLPEACSPELALLPDSLRDIGVLHADDPQFWQLLLLSLRRDVTGALSHSSSTLWSLVSQTTPLVNGQVVYLIKVQIKGLFRPRYCIQIESSPQTGPLQESAINELIAENMFENMLDSLQLTDSNLTFTDSAWISLMIIGSAVIWLIGFLLVILKLPDSKVYTLPVRLCVFILPAALLLVSIVYRWKSLDSRKAKRTRRLFNRTGFLNAQLFQMNKNVLATSVKNPKQNNHIIYLVHYSVSPCSQTIRHILKTLKEAELAKLHLFSSLVQQQERMDFSLDSFSFHDHLCLLFANSYLSCLLSHNLISSLYQRHTRKYQCLCQYIEDFLSAYLPIIRYPQKFNEKHTESVFRRFFLSTITINSNFVAELGIGSTPVSFA